MKGPYEELSEITLRCVKYYMPVWVMIEKGIEIMLEEEEL
jgi:hypothetical protein